MKPYRFPFHAMACGCEVVVCAAAEPQASAWAAVAMAEVRRVEVKYSRYRPESIVSRINAAAGGRAVACDDETLSLLDGADSLHRQSGGLFDITSGVLRRAWNFKVPDLPARQELAALVGLIGWPRVERTAGCIRLPQPGMEIDFGGFGKEYAADRAASAMHAAGARHGYVNLGGDMRMIGPRPDGSPWAIGIRDPRNAARIVATVPVAAGGLATSGDDERYFELGGRRYCHVLDPHTGWPVSTWRTVSVRAPQALLAGAFATIAMLKRNQAIDFLDASGMDYLAIDQDGTVHTRGTHSGEAVAESSTALCESIGV